METLPNYTYFVVPQGFQPEEAGGHGPVQVQVVHAGAAEHVPAQRRLLQRRPVPRRDHHHGLRRRDQPDQRADLRPGRRRRLPLGHVDRDGAERRRRNLDRRRREHGADHDAHGRRAVQRRAGPPGDAADHRPARELKLSSSSGTVILGN